MKECTLWPKRLKLHKIFHLKSITTVATAIVFLALTFLPPFIPKVQGAGWLFGWDKRIKITISPDNVDDTLSDFPILVYLSGSSGTTNADVTPVFDEVGASSSKIAFTESDETTELFYEVEKWDNVGEEAWVWVKVTSVSNTGDTEFYLYYDKDHADNPKHSATDVWDGSHKMVQHLEETGTGTRYDSTTNDNDGATSGYEGDEAITGQINGADDFDGNNDYVNCGNKGSLQLTGAMTVETWVKLASDNNGSRGIVGKTQTALNRGWVLGRHSNNYLKFTCNDSVATAISSDNTFTDTNWHQVVVTRDSAGLTKMYIDNVLQADSKTLTITDSGQSALIGKWYSDYDGYYFKGIIDETRISDMAREPEWIEASYYSGRDDLVSYGDEVLAAGEDEAVPEFTTITFIIAAVAGFGIYFLIRQRKEKKANI